MNREELKQDYETGWNLSQEESLKYVESASYSYAEKFYEGDENVSPQEINGFQIGIVVYFTSVTKGLLPEFIKNIRAEAVKGFERVVAEFHEIDIPQEFYKGFITGFCNMHFRNGCI